jgi:hypothetical protein
VNTSDPVLTARSASGDPGLETDLGQTVRGLATGERVFMRYTLKRILGRGGMGMVWLARDDKLDRDVALKFVPELLFLDAAARDDLKKETRRSLELTHPNIVRIYDFMEDESMAAISMEYVDGPTLSHLRVNQASRCFEPADIQPWLSGLCAALDYAHGTARMVHRDLKPANLMLNGRGIVKIADFGIACSLMGSVARVSIYTSSAGTLVYMSPQQMLGEMPSHLDDIYALGATLYELITGKPPFYSGDVTYQARECEPESMASRRAKLGSPGGIIPPAWEQTIAACLAKDPARRPQSAREIFERLTSGGEAQPAAYEVTAPTMRLPVPMRNGIEATSHGASHTQPRIVPPDAPAEPYRPIPARPRFPLRPATLAAIVSAVAIIAGLVAWMAWPHRGGESTSGIATPSGFVPTAPAAVAGGGLMIKTSPAGAMVQLGGEEIETAPAVFKAIPPGKYPLRIVLADYEAAEMQVEIKADEFTDLGTIALVHSTGGLALSSSPEGSDYQLKADASGAVRTGRTPETIRDLPTGSYTIAYKQDGWPDQTRAVQVKRNETAPVDLQFPQGVLSVTSTPPGAKVYIGDRVLGVTPLNTPLAPGDYQNIQVVMDGMAPVTLGATVREGATATLDAGQLHEMITALQLQTTPAGLAYAISGTAGDLRSGQTPAAIFDLPVGDYTVTIERPGWADFTSPLSLMPKVPVTITHDFPEGSVVITSQPMGAEIYQGENLLGTAPLTVNLPPGNTELTAKLSGMPVRKHSVTVDEGEETNLAFDMESGSSSISAHHHRHVKKQPPSELAKLGDSIKSFFSGSSSGSKAGSR